MTIDDCSVESPIVYAKVFGSELQHLLARVDGDRLGTIGGRWIMVGQATIVPDSALSEIEEAWPR